MKEGKIVPATDTSYAHLETGGKRGCLPKWLQFGARRREEDAELKRKNLMNTGKL